MNEQTQNLLSRLDKVEELTPGKHKARYRACCPAHDDSSPSLSVTETLNGTVLVKCWAGCSAHEVVSSVGMTLSDLFPPSDRIDHRRKGDKRAFSMNDAAVVLARDALVVLMAAAKLRSGDKLSSEDFDALVSASGRCQRVVDEVLA